MNLKHLLELNTEGGYFVVLGLIAAACALLPQAPVQRMAVGLATASDASRRRLCV
jgi:hypothetical protein